LSHLRAATVGAAQRQDVGAPRTELDAEASRPLPEADVELRVVHFTTTRLPMRSCEATIECSAVRVGRYVEGIQADVTVYPVSHAMTVLWMDETHLLTSGHRPNRLLARRAGRACMADLFERLVQMIRTETEATASDGGRSAPNA
jgi:hypothetical protein